MPPSIDNSGVSSYRIEHFCRNNPVPDDGMQQDITGSVIGNFYDPLTNFGDKITYR